MAVGKNKRTVKRKGGKKKPVDPFTRKEWFDVVAPSIFSKPTFAKMPVNKTAGRKISTEVIKGRVFEANLADLNNNEEMAYRKMKLVLMESEGNRALTTFYGMDFTRDRLYQLMRKNQTMIEAFVDAKTTDGYVLRMFCMGFTKRRPNQVAKTSYAQTGQVRQIRKKMMDIMRSEAEKSDLKALVQKFIPEALGEQIEKACQSIYPLQNVFIRKVKVLKAPKFDHVKFMEMHEAVAASGEDTGAPVEGVDPATEEVAGAGGRLS